MDLTDAHLAPLLDRLVDFERLRPAQREWDLAAIERLLRRGDAPAPVRPAVQVAGSKGKGTTAAMLAALVSATGRCAGCFSSPHVVTLRERIRVGTEPVPLAALDRLLGDLLAVPAERAPTFFEAMTAAAVAWFAERRVDLAIYEVGLGGRHDATTAVPVDASIVTRIELEHTEVLGDTIPAIAAEKAAVVRPGGLGLTSTTGDALAVVRARAAEVDAELLVLGEHFGLSDVTWSGDVARGALWLPGDGDGGERRPFVMPGASAFALPALALAAATARCLLPDMPIQLQPVPRPILPCRFEVFDEADGEVLVLDGAHTEHSLRAVAEELQRRFPGRRSAVLCASAARKRWREGLSRLLPIADSFVVTGLSGTACEDPAAIVAWLREQGATGEVATDAVSGLRSLRQRPGPRLVVGSFYLAGAIRQQLDEPPTNS